jgi:HD-GYP domain-containing protein (c-di-GMP phosphodiesterase class II)
MLDQNEKLREIIRLGSELNNIQDLDLLLEKILFEARRVVNADAGSIYVRDGALLIFTQVQNETKQKKLLPGQKLIYSTFKVPINKKSISGYVASTGDILNIPDVYKLPPELPYHFDPSYDKISGYRTTSMMTVPMKNMRGDILGVLQIINAKEGSEIVPFDRESEPYILHFAGTASIVLQRAKMTRALLIRMISMAEMRDPHETASHVNRVASIAVELYEEWARRRGITRTEIDKNRDIFRMAAMLHDVGKVGISDLILKKPARLTPEEFEIMKTHAYLGARLFMDSQSEFDDMACQVALNHHENWDGTGYPGYIDLNTGQSLKEQQGKGTIGKMGDDIPIYGRIVALADVFDALSSKRVYKDAWEEKDVLFEIISQKGKKFDPEIVNIFSDKIDLIRSITKRYVDE